MSIRSAAKLILYSAELYANTIENAKDVAELLFIGMDTTRHGNKNVDVGRDALRCFIVCLNQSLRAHF
jgi:hypothetical protein